MAYGYRRKLTIDSLQVASDLAYLPTLVNFTNASFKSVANGGNIQDGTNGFDLAFFSDAELTTQLNHEVEEHNLSTGEILMWVSIPSTSSSVDTDFYVGYGDSGISSSQENVAGTWSENGANYFKGVWHLNDASGDFLDSSGNTNTLTATGSPTYGAAGVISDAVTFTATNPDYGRRLSSPITAVPITLSCWAKVTDRSLNQALISLVDKGGTGQFWMYSSNAYTVNIQVRPAPYPTASSPGSIINNTWYYATAVFASSTSIISYFNGVGGTEVTGECVPTGIDNILIGVFETLTDYKLDGSMDEARIAQVARSADWIAAEYANQKASSTYLALAAEEILATSAMKDIVSWGVIGRPR